MEWKIGEIKQLNGEWYQCIEQPEKYDKTVCDLCDFHGIGNCELDRCSGTYRNDKKSVIFKKLEKIGEQFLYKGKQMQSYIRATDELICNWNNNLLLLERGGSNIIDIEIKQNKEDMEEKKLNLKPFDIQKAREGKPVCTRDGRKARIICFDFRDVEEICCLIVAVDYGEAEKIYYYDSCGKYRGGDSSKYDLMMLPEKKEGWINVYRNEKSEYWSEQIIFSTKKEATDFVNDHTQYVTTVKITWEE